MTGLLYFFSWSCLKEHRTSCLKQDPVQVLFKQDFLGTGPSRGRGLQPASTSENPWGNRKDYQLLT